jgi:CHAT domain-containing protein
MCAEPAETSSAKVASSQASNSPVAASSQALPLSGSVDGNVPIADSAGLRRTLPSLPDTRCELQQMAHTLGAGDGSLFLGADATETALKALSSDGTLASYRTVGFATHGLMSGEVGAAEPALVLTPPERGSAHDDGLLTASEVAGLRLGADWVILSACNTAAGLGADADTLSGLARAFFYAGANALMVSHWYVPTDAAVELTTGTVARLKAAPDAARPVSSAAARALQGTMVEMIDRGFSPGLWAPFSVVGGSR